MIGNRCRTQQKPVSVWLTQAEGQDATIKEQLETLYPSENYKIAVFHFDHVPLYQNTLELLRYNHRRSVVRAVQSAKSTPEQ